MLHWMHISSSYDVYDIIIYQMVSHNFRIALFGFQNITLAYWNLCIHVLVMEFIYQFQ